MIINVYGAEKQLKRLGPANIHEQLRVMRHAKKQGAQIVILECMALSPELQLISQKDIVKSDLSVITNVRYDHIYEMGSELEEIGTALCAVIPDGGTLFTGEDDLFHMIGEKCNERNCTALKCLPNGCNDANEAIAREIALHLGLNNEEIDAGFANAISDFGSQQIYELKNNKNENIAFLSLFSANDPISSKQRTDSAVKSYENFAFIYNHRADRPERLELFAERFFIHYPASTVYIAGENKMLAKKILGKNHSLKLISINSLSDCLDTCENTLIIGVGNIKGAGYKMIELLENKS